MSPDAHGRRSRAARCAALALCAAALLLAAGGSTGPRPGPSGGFIVYPNGEPPSPPRHFIEPYVTSVTTYNGDSYASGVGAYTYTDVCVPAACCASLVIRVSLLLGLRFSRRR